MGLTTTQPSPSESTAFSRCTDTVAAPLPAHRDEWERRAFDDPHLFGDIAFALGGPFHLMYPRRIGRNIRGFQDAFRRNGLEGAIYFGKKANKAACVVRACAEYGAGVDVASTGELTAALAHGVRGEDLMVTGPEKSGDLLWLAARHGALIAVDSTVEIERIAGLGISARVLLRMLPDASTSRFGMTGDEAEHASAVAARHSHLHMEGFSFHLSGYDPAPRAELAADLIDRCRSARRHGHPAKTISLGGGFGVDYVPSNAWSTFTEGLSARWFHSGKRLGSYYPYYFATPGPAMLETLLQHNGLANQLRANDIEVAIEPGRALLDGAGSTIFRVQGNKTRHEHGEPYQLLTVDGSSLSLSEQWFDSEYLPDPLLWPAHPGTPTPTVIGAATCLESDMLSWRRIPLPRRSTRGDLLVYPNTAGYQMDSNESSFHELPLPPKVVLHEAPGGRYRWALDAG